MNAICVRITMFLSIWKILNKVNYVKACATLESRKPYIPPNITFLVDEKYVSTNWEVYFIVRM